MTQIFSNFFWHEKIVLTIWTEQEKEEGGEFYPLQRLSPDLATQRKLGYLSTLKKPSVTNIKSILHQFPLWLIAFCFGLLGGNSRTAMVAALSPADINYDETLSTLRSETC